MEKIILPLVTNPPTVAYQNKANYLGILLTDQNYEKEFYVDYVNLTWNTQNSSCGFETAAYNHHFRDDCFLEVEGLYIKNNMRFIGDDDPYGHLLQKIIEKIKKGFYVKGFFDEFYIPAKKSYKKCHYKHDFMLYGVDEYERKLIAIGYTKSDTYVTYDIAFDDFKRSLMSLERMASPGEYMFFVEFLKLKENNTYKFNYDKVVKRLYYYLHPEKINSYDFLYGIDAFDKIISQLNIKFDLRQVRLLMEHKNMMLDRLNYLHQNNYCQLTCEIDEYEKLVKYMFSIFHIAVKYSMTHSEEDLAQITAKLKTLKNEEVQVLSTVYEKLVQKTEVLA